VMAIAPRSVVVTEPVDAAGKTVDGDAVQKEYAWVLANDKRVRVAAHVRVVAGTERVETSVN